MKNYLSKHYEHYYVQTADGQSVEVARAECFALGEAPTAENPHTQRWFYDVEGNYIVRLPRNEQSEELYRFNCANVRKEARYKARQSACLMKGSGRCNDDCHNCQLQRFSRFVELDKPLFFDSEGEPICTEIAVMDEYSEGNIGEPLSFVEELPPKQQDVIRLHFFEGKSITEIVNELKIDRKSIYERLERALKNLRKNF